MARWVRALVLVLLAGGSMGVSCASVSGLTPPLTAPGDRITIAGYGFGASQGIGDGVLYDGVPIAVESWSDSKVVARVPADKAPGTYAVQLRLVGGTLPVGSHSIANLVVGMPVGSVNPKNHLSGLVSFETTVPATPAVQVAGPEGTWIVPVTGAITPVPATVHTVAVVGLRAGNLYTITARAVAGSQTVSGPSFTYQPQTFEQISGFAAPPITITTSQPGAMQPGLTLFAATRIGFPSTSRIYAIDAAGKIVWYHQDPPVTPPDPFVPITRVRQLKNGNILYLSSALYEIDLLGTTVRSYTSEGLGMDPAVDGPAHHDVIELPNGNLLGLFAELRNVSGYPPDAGTFCSTCRVVGDQIVEFTRDGQIVDRIHLFDLLDPKRTLLDIHQDVGESFNDASWNWWYGTGGGSTHDWTHCNALVHDPSDDSILVSCRHQDLIAKISRSSKKLVWVLGSNWAKSSGDDAWPFLKPAGPGLLLPLHQHGPFLKPNGNVLVYDNGNDRPGGEYTRQVEYVIDPYGSYFDQAWEWIDPDFDPPIFSYFAGNIEGQPNGNVLITDGSLPGSTQWMRFSEVRTSDSTKVWEARLQDPSAQYSGLDAVRIPSLYPPVP